MSIYSKFATDPNLETGDGVTIDFGEFTITLNRAGGANRAYLKAFSDKIKPYRLMIEAGNMDDTKANQIMAEVYADTVIKNWSGIKDEKGKTIAYSRENVIKVLTDLPEFFDRIQKEAQDLANFRKVQLEADAKNSAKS